MKNTPTGNNSTQTKDFFDGYAAGFDEIYGAEKGLLWNLINRYLRKSMRLRYEYTIQACLPAAGKTILDVGCGPGHYSLALASEGAMKVVGIDFAPAMIDLAKSRSIEAELEDRTEFQVADFFDLEQNDPFDHLILMGFMDYIAEPALVVEKALGMCQQSAFFSFPVSHGLLAYQRKLRYKKRCPLYLYDYDQVVNLFAPYNDFRFRVRKISRDYWVMTSRIS